MLKKLLFGTGLFLAVLPAAAQTASQIEKDHPLEAPTPENPKYREQHKTRDYTGINRDPKLHSGSPAHRTEAAKADTLAPAEEKKRPQR